ncbi:PilZ domain-containing protein [Bythopirellula polymerisocia]|uniref:PilZ domain-containing protein n=1 Tax=Bythopirellula polymerisocia TaxID=2528003 RepID=A0A5C6CF02_9BACT|nr:PilZ domain-containing protein [Bythopirellula polymerisocia]TWU22682.1 hypothetical protein Pla144_41420 [Bythopirellula polymerisocia]
MASNTTKSSKSDQILSELLQIALKDSDNNRRSEKRFPFFRPISVQIDNHSFSAFTREVSISGIGLLHSMELPLKEVSITLAEQPKPLHVLIERCESIGEGWYISGGKLVDRSC